MSDSWSGKVDEMKSRLKAAVSSTEGDIDADAMMARVREAVGKAGSDVDTEALMARVKEVAGKAEGKVDTEKLKQWIDDVDAEKLKGWLDEARAFTASAATAAEAQGEKLAERAPGMFDKVVGAAKEMFGDVTGNEDLAREGELEKFRGEIKERFAGAADTVADETKNAADAAKKVVDDRSKSS